MTLAPCLTRAAALLWMPLAASCMIGTAMAQQTPAATAAFHALVDEAWETDMRDDPLRASYFGDRRYESQWPDVSPAALAKRNDVNTATLARLQKIDRASLSTQDQLSYDLFAWEYKTRLGAYPFKPFLYDVRPRDGVQTLSEQAELIPFSAVSDYEHWIARLKNIDRYLAQTQSLLEVGIREKRTQPRVVMERVLPQLADLIKPGAESNPFYAPFKRIPDSFSAADRARLQAEGKAAIEGVVIPAYAK